MTIPQPTMLEHNALHLSQIAGEELCRYLPDLQGVLIVFDWHEQLIDAVLPSVYVARSRDISPGAGILHQLAKLLSHEIQQRSRELPLVQQAILQQREIMVNEANWSQEDKDAAIAQWRDELSRRTGPATAAKPGPETTAEQAAASPDAR